MKVRHDRCDTCLFRLKYPREIRERILGEVEREDSFVACHKYPTPDDEEEEEGGRPRGEVMCHGFYRREPFATPYMRLAAMLGAVVYVDEDGQPVACPLPPRCPAA